MKKRYMIYLTAIMSLIIIEIMLGVFLFIAGKKEKTVDNEKIEVMKEFIKEYNPTFYDMIVSNEDLEAKKAFFDHYTKKGNKEVTLIGLLLILMALNSFVTTMIIYFRKNETKETIQPEEKGKDVVEEKKEDKKEENKS